MPPGPARGCPPNLNGKLRRRCSRHGEVWEWTRSSYDPYPGFKPFDGVAAEYNGKFMVGQIVLRGGSSPRPPGHIRTTYRNFFPPHARWQFSGIPAGGGYLMDTPLARLHPDASPPADSFAECLAGRPAQIAQGNRLQIFL